MYMNYKYTNAQILLGHLLFPSFPWPGADATKNDGVYSRYFIAYDTNGRYSVKIWALGGINTVRQGTASRSNGALLVAGWIENGK